MTIVNSFRNAFAFLTVAFLFASCSNIYRNVQGVESAPSTEIRPATGETIVHSGVMLQGAAKETVRFGIFRSTPNTQAILGGDVSNFRTKGSNALKEKALYSALKDTEYDIIVNPKYLLTEKKTLFTKETTVQVIGYAGSIVYDK